MITVAELRARLKITDTAQDAALATLIARATAALGRALNRYLGPPMDKVETRAGGCGCTGQAGQTAIYLWDDPAGSITTVRERARAGAPWVTLAPGDYDLTGRTLTRLPGPWPNGPGTVEITYPVGFSEGEGPAEYLEVVAQIAAAWYAARQAGAQRADVAGETIGDYSYTRFQTEDFAAVPGLRAFVDRYRRRIV